MTKLPLISGKKLCSILEKIGFEKIQGKGSHVRYKHPDGRITVVPVHGNEEIGREILKQIKINRKEYEKLRREA